MYPIVYVIQKIENGFVVKYREVARAGMESAVIEKLMFFSSLEAVYQFVKELDDKLQSTVDDLMEGGRLVVPEMQMP